MKKYNNVEKAYMKKQFWHPCYWLQSWEQLWI